MEKSQQELLWRIRSTLGQADEKVVRDLMDNDKKICEGCHKKPAVFEKRGVHLCADCVVDRTKEAQRRHDGRMF